MQRRKRRLDITPLIVGVFFLALMAYVFLFPEFFGKKKIVVFKITGELISESVPPSFTSEGIPGSFEIAKNIEELNNRTDVAAVVFLIDSPGGDVVAAQEIYEAIEKLNKTKVAYIRGMGTSGGYYIALATDEIIANKYAVTGSIGVLLPVTSLAGLMKKIGANITAIKSGEMKDIGAFYKNLSESEKRILQSMVNEIFSEFKKLVLEKRGEKIKYPSKVFDGRPLIASSALELGLIDKIGNLDDAIKEAARLANLSEGEYEIEYTQPKFTDSGFVVRIVIPEPRLKNEMKIKME